MAYGQDLGGVRVLLPVLRRLNHSPLFTLEVFGSRQAAEVFQAGCVACTTLESLRQRLPLSRQAARRFVQAQAPAIFLTGTSHYGDPTNAHLLRACRDLGVRTVALLDHWKNLDRFGELTEDGFAFAPDILGVMDEKAKRALQDLGFDSERLALVGHPYLEDIYKAKKQWLSSRRSQELKRRAGIPPHVLMILCCSEMLHAHGPSDVCGAGCRPLFEVEDRGRTLLQRVQQVGQMLQQRTGRSCVVAFRPHPFEASRPGGVWPASLAVLDQRVCSDVEAVAAADMVVGVSSMPLLQASVLGKPVASLLLLCLDKQHRRRPRHFAGGLAEAFSIITTWSSLERMAEHVAMRDWCPPLLSPQARTMLKDATGRVVRLLQKMTREEFEESAASFRTLSGRPTGVC